MPANEIIPRLFGNYLITEKLGSDALGKVYRARKIDQREAFFRLRIFDAPGLETEPVLVAIEQNGAIHDFLKNPSITKDVELDSVEGDAFLAHREPGGRTLDVLISESRRRPFPIPIEHALLIAEKVATGLDHAYNTQIDGERTLHGLVWPGFVDVSDEGEARLSGFGLAEGILASRETPAIAELLFPYLAPEVRATGRPSKFGDVYSSAAILVEMLTGIRPSLSDAAEAVAGARLAGRHEPIPPDIAGVLKVALAASPEDRFETAGAFRRELGKLLFSGTYAPSTFNLAFFLTNLFKEDIASEQARRTQESQMDAAKYPRPEVTARPPRLVATPRFGVPVVAQEEPIPRRSPVAVVLGILVGAAIVVGSVLLMRIKSTKPLVPLPVKPSGPTGAPSAAPAPPTPGMTPEQFKAEVARQLSEEMKKLEAQEAKGRKPSAAAEIAALEPTPAPIPTPISAPRPIGEAPPPAPHPAPAAPAPAASVPQPRPVEIRGAGEAAPKPIPTAPSVRRGDLVAFDQLDVRPTIATVVKPEYPDPARQAKVSGVVLLDVLVTETGRVEQVKILRDPGMGLGASAASAMRSWTFRPGMKGGVPVKTWYPVPIPFVL